MRAPARAPASSSRDYSGEALLLTIKEALQGLPRSIFLAHSHAQRDEQRLFLERVSQGVRSHLRKSATGAVGTESSFGGRVGGRQASALDLEQPAFENRNCALSSKMALDVTNLDNLDAHPLTCNSPLFLACLAVLSNLVGFLSGRESRQTVRSRSLPHLNPAPFRVNETTRSLSLWCSDDAAHRSCSKALGLKEAPGVKVHLINPSSVSFGTAVITPRWQYVLAAATPKSFGDPILVDETLLQLRPDSIQAGDAVGIGIHTANALRGYEIGKMARSRGAYVIFGGIHATLYPEEALELGGAHAVVKGDGDIAWGKALADCREGVPKPIYVGGQIEASDFVAARWDLVPRNRYMWASVQTVRGCPKHCSFCSVWRTDGQRPRQRASDVVIEEIVQLRRLGFRFIALADDNFYPVTLDRS